MAHGDALPGGLSHRESVGEGKRGRDVCVCACARERVRARALGVRVRSERVVRHAEVPFIGDGEGGWRIAVRSSRARGVASRTGWQGSRGRHRVPMLASV